ncbi:hypothetical protein B0T14DRAFT_559137 [Immersiella caudata]|uniref:mRNA stability protein n=1 Tax=Immersiella caudata TaxID=314043 RepID=A0AA40CBD8_9PEZI|nr:hypothetical protein B0T14DRAFT_559137 [Immersiella caudata]
MESRTKMMDGSSTTITTPTSIKINTTPVSPTNSNPLSPDRLLRLYGRLPTTPPRRFAAHLKSERKYFDSGDYAISKAGRGDGVNLGTVGVLHPTPEMIPHPLAAQSGVVGNDGEQMGGKMQRRKSSLGSLV